MTKSTNTSQHSTAQVDLGESRFWKPSWGALYHDLAEGKTTDLEKCWTNTLEGQERNDLVVEGWIFLWGKRKPVAEEAKNWLLNKMPMEKVVGLAGTDEFFWQPLALYNKDLLESLPANKNTMRWSSNAMRAWTKVEIPQDSSAMGDALWKVIRQRLSPDNQNDLLGKDILPMLVVMGNTDKIRWVVEHYQGNQTQVLALAMAWYYQGNQEKDPSYRERFLARVVRSLKGTAVVDGELLASLKEDIWAGDLIKINAVFAKLALQSQLTPSRTDGKPVKPHL